jgi:uncharacterized protein YcbK (DUF882 family)
MDKRRAFRPKMWQFARMATDQKKGRYGIHLDRRGFLRGLGAAAAGLTASRAALAGGSGRRALSFVHTHTGEQLSTVYYEAGAYVVPALQRVNQLLRDFRTDTLYPIDPGVLDRLYLLQAASGSDEPFQVICGYRSPATNQALRHASSGVAEHSLHMEGRAIDVRLPGIDTARLALLARSQQGGGVGYYHVSDFVHVDTGRVRIWGDPLPI